ncbi:hypothetical protein DIS18_11980 [Algibacter marinivivus]|uniref:Transglutaminase-like domain-containing protein n=1 Tax=Algibacter marinivivus TaxID=2100723 RepID=A0A2U2X2H2_9FLAO|nr:transglutaminase domain-containing protein [Algibacter marinivivus]PWH81981.1 hypothetical protein DIS18_11980 [Algibacter marinivivus]
MKHCLLIFILLCSFIINAQKSDFKHINFKKADSVAYSCENVTLKNVPLLAFRLTQNLDTEVEKFRSIYIWVCSNIESDHGFGELTLKKRRRFKNDSVGFSQWNNQVQSKVFKRLLKEQKTICTGYAYLIKELANLVDIDCEIIDGYSRTTKRNVGKIDIPNHSWNAVKLNNKWYQVDATLASGYFDVNKYKFVKNYNDGYFLAASELYQTKHYPLKNKWLLTNDYLSLNEFVKGPVTYGNTFKYNVIPVSPKKLKTKIFVNDEVVFTFKVHDNIEINRMRLVLSSGIRSKTIKASQSDYSKGYIELKHRFLKKGSYDVHFIINTDFIASYTIKVEKNNNQNLIAIN